MAGIPGSESGACKQGFPRNLGGPDVSHGKMTTGEGNRMNKRSRPVAATRTEATGAKTVRNVGYRGAEGKRGKAG